MSHPARLTRGAAVLWIDATRPLTLTAGLVMVVFALVGGARDDIGFSAPGWTNAFNDALTANLYLAPLCAGTAILVAQDVARLRLDTWLAALPNAAARSATMRAAAIYCWALLSYVVVLLGIAARTGTYGTPGIGELLLLLLAQAVVVGSIVAGTAIGARVRHRAFGPFVALVFFAAQYLTSYLTGWQQRLSPVYPDISYAPFLRPHLALMGWQILFVIGIGSCAATLLFTRRPRAMSLVAVAAGVCVAGGVAGISATAAQPLEVSPPPAQPLCRHVAGGRVCLRPADAYALGPTSTVYGLARTQLRGIVDVPRYLREPGMSGSTAQTGRGIFVPPDPGSPQSAYADDIVYSLVPDLECTGPRSAASLRAIDNIYLWIRVRIDSSTVPDFVQHRLSDVVSRSPSRQRAWLRGQFRLVRECRR